MEKEVEVGELKEISAKEIRYRYHKSGNPLEEALMLKNLLEEHKQQELAKTLKMSQGQISKRLRLLSLLPPLQKRLLNGELRPSTAYALSKLPHEIQKDYVNKKRVLLKEVEDRKRSLAITEELEILLESPINIPSYEFSAVLSDVLEKKLSSLIVEVQNEFDVTPEEVLRNLKALVDSWARMKGVVSVEA